MIYEPRPQLQILSQCSVFDFHLKIEYVDEGESVFNCDGIEVKFVFYENNHQNLTLAFCFFFSFHHRWILQDTSVLTPVAICMFKIGF